MNNKKYQIKDSEFELIAQRVEKVKRAGHGEVIIRVADGKIVYITHTIGEKVRGK